MQKLYKFLFCSPEDIGMQGYKIEEIAKRMQRSEDVDQSSLIDFAKTVKIFLDKDSKDTNLTTVSS